MQCAALRGGILKGLAYPLVVTCLAAVILLFIIICVGGNAQRILIDFDVSLPAITIVFFWWRDIGLWLLAGLVAGVIGAVLVVRWRLNEAGWRRLLATVPIVGPIWHWSALAEWSSLLGLLLRHEIPLPLALRLAAEGVSDANVARLSMGMADGVSRGRSLSQAMTSVHEIPASLVPLVNWGEKAGSLAESLGTGRELLEQRVRTRSCCLQTILPWILFIAIGCGVFFVVGSLFVPLISLIQALSG